MTPMIIFLLSSLAIYLLVIRMLRQKRWHLRTFLWGAFGLVFIIVETAVFIGLHAALAKMEASHIQSLMAITGHPITVINDLTLLIPDSLGWTGMIIGLESSTLIEMAVFIGVIVFYPKFSWQMRLTYGVIGVVGTYILNLVRLLTIIFMVMTMGREVFPLAHSVVGRLVYFGGIVALYWFLLTKPTLWFVRNKINIQKVEA